MISTTAYNIYHQAHTTAYRKNTCIIYDVCLVCGKNDRNKLKNTNITDYFRFDKSLKCFYSHRFRLTNKTTIRFVFVYYYVHTKKKTINDHTFHKERFPLKFILFRSVTSIILQQINIRFFRTYYSIYFKQYL